MLEKNKDYFDNRYSKLMKSKSGKKIIDIMIVLANGLLNIREIQSELLKINPMPRSTVVECLRIAEKKGYIDHCYKSGKFRYLRGNPKRGLKDRRSGRPSYLYWLTSDGLLIIRLVPRIREKWSQVASSEAHVENIVPLFDSVVNIMEALGEDPDLCKNSKPYYFMNGELQRTILNPFVWIHEADEKLTSEL